MSRPLGSKNRPLSIRLKERYDTKISKLERDIKVLKNLAKTYSAGIKEINKIKKHFKGRGLWMVEEKDIDAGMWVNCKRCIAIRSEGNLCL